MDNAGEQEFGVPPQAAPPQPPHRPQPPRPEFSATPLRPAPTDTTPRAITVARSAWIGSFAVLIGIGAATALKLTAVRDALESALSAERPGTSNRDIADTVSVTLLGCASAAALLLVAGLICLHLLGGRRNAARLALAVVGVVSVAAAIVFWSLMVEAGEASGGVLEWAPLVYAGLVAVGVAALFAPGVSRWLRH
ncbi:hypothetical protein [Rhodococcus maanshanensis]|uniref:Uncharacterized protein n=1 Tax=Rhodococcus maanshanensis TaxID=183556 RepID=A0A1H7RCY8_9NOCA|nr:hypothetical protein [Rhodococcus maanshanensis]SEL58002.1 hypothetical protein SAMN05444583_11144 [Rhodococcus maanshanensis]